jgi:hypothetical protein
VLLARFGGSFFNLINKGETMKSVMDHSFARVPSADIQRSSFDRSHGHKTTFDVGKLVPIFVDEALPGDTFNLSMTGFGRLATPIYPLMDNMYMDVHFFSVPMRQLWNNFRKFMGEQEDPGDSTDYVIPNGTMTPTEGSFEDYIGLPVGVEVTVSSMFQRAYRHIYNEWYRDQNLQDSLSLDVSDTGENTVQALLPRGKRHDYFTSCLPWPQKGDAVTIPLGETAPVLGIGIDSAFVDNWDGSDVVAENNSGVGGQTTFSRSLGNAVGDSGIRIEGHATPYATDPNDYAPNVRADLTNAVSATINQLRQSFQIQKLLERDARGGTRYAEIVNSHFGVFFQDVTYRPEYLGGGSTRINMNPVAQTSSTDATTPQGNLSAFGTLGVNNVGFTKSFTEHCIVLGIASVRADLNYQQGINRMFSRSTRYDFYWPALAHIGEQAVLNKEIYAQGTSADDDVFGYQERYAEYRYKPSIVTGKMRSDATGSLDAWHLAQDFSSLPTLDSSFIEENPPLDRCIALSSEPHIILDTYFNFRSARPMPVFGVPGLIDHF